MPRHVWRGILLGLALALSPGAIAGPITGAFIGSCLGLLVGVSILILVGPRFRNVIVAEIERKLTERRARRLAGASVPRA